MDSTPQTVEVRSGTISDAQSINDIYNWYVTHSTITFDLTPWSLEQRQNWIGELQNTAKPHHLLVASIDSVVVGFCYNAMFRPKAAYDLSTEVTIYTQQPSAPRGTGAALYSELFSLLKTTSLHRAYAGISQPNPESVRFHKKFGFELIGTLQEVGAKFDQWIDVAWYEKKLDEDSSK